MRTHLRATLITSAVTGLAAVTTPAAQGATLSWTVTNPDPSGEATLTGIGPLTIRNTSGTLQITCKPYQMSFFLPSGSHPYVGYLYYESGIPDCQDDKGNSWSVGTIIGGGYPLHGAAYDSATGTSSIQALMGPIGVWQLEPTLTDCFFITNPLNMTYTNSTSIMRFTTARAVVALPEDGKTRCEGLVSTGDEVTFAADFAVSPAVTITAATS